MRIVNTTPAVQYLNYRDGTVIAIEPMGYVIRPAGDLDYLDDSAVSLARFSSGLLVLRNDDGSAYTGAALPSTPVAPVAQAVTVSPAGYLQGSGATAAALSSAVSGGGDVTVNNRDGAGRVTSYAEGGVTFTVTYTAAGNVNTVSGGGRITTYSYDASGQLTGSTTV